MNEIPNRLLNCSSGERPSESANCVTTIRIAQESRNPESPPRRAPTNLPNGVIPGAGFNCLPNDWSSADGSAQRADSGPLERFG